MRRSANTPSTALLQRGPRQRAAARAGRRRRRRERRLPRVGLGLPEQQLAGEHDYWVNVVFDTSPADTTSPTSTATFPASSASYNIAGWNAGCATPGFCGTASDLGSGLQKVELSIRRGSGNYWNGSAFASTSEVFLAATGTTPWSYAFARTSFPADGEYTVRVRSTDLAGNVETPVARLFTYDATAPSSSATFPAASTAYSAAGWNAGCATPGVCGTASDLASGRSGMWSSRFDGAAGTTGTGVPSPARPRSSWPRRARRRGATPCRRRASRGRLVHDPARARGQRRKCPERLRLRAFTYDGNGPTVTATFPAAGGNYSLVSWAAGCVPAGFCGTASGPDLRHAACRASVDPEGRRGTTGRDWFVSASEVFVPATGTSAWN